MKITEKSLKDICNSANQGALKCCQFGLFVERWGTGFLLFKLFRKSALGRERLSLEPLTAREAKVMIDGFVAAFTAADVYRSGLEKLTAYAVECRRKNTADYMEGLVVKINNTAETLCVVSQYQFDGEGIIQSR